MTNKEVIEKLVPIYEQAMMLAEDVKLILKKAKEDGLDQTALAKVAKAKAQDNLGDLADKTNALKTLIDEVND
jgi:uncharacterized protein (UPF0335 family)